MNISIQLVNDFTKETGIGVQSVIRLPDATLYVVHQVLHAHLPDHHNLIGIVITGEATLESSEIVRDMPPTFRDMSVAFCEARRIHVCLPKIH